MTRARAWAVFTPRFFCPFAAERAFPLGVFGPSLPLRLRRLALLCSGVGLSGMSFSQLFEYQLKFASQVFGYVCVFDSLDPNDVRRRLQPTCIAALNAAQNDRRLAPGHRNTEFEQHVRVVI